jgi:hypothetical protein
MLMTAHARTESTLQAKDEADRYKKPEGYNVFNLQFEKALPNTNTLRVPRKEYVDPVPEAEAENINMKTMTEVTSGSHKMLWPKYKEVSPGVIKQLGTKWVRIPDYRNMEEAIQGYLAFLEKKPGQTAYKALTDPASGSAKFYEGLKGYGTAPAYANAQEEIGKLAREVSGLLVAYAKERLPQLKRDMQWEMENLADINQDIEDLKQQLEAAQDPNDKAVIQDDIETNQRLASQSTERLENLKREERVLNRVVSGPLPNF